MQVRLDAFSGVTSLSRLTLDLPAVPRENDEIRIPFKKLPADWLVELKEHASKNANSYEYLKKRLFDTDGHGMAAVFTCEFAPIFESDDEGETFYVRVSSEFLKYE